MNLFFLHTILSIKETLCIHWYFGQSWKSTPFLVLINKVSFSTSLPGPWYFVKLSSAGPVWKPTGRSPPANVLLPGEPLGRLCQRRLCLGSLGSLGSWLPRIRYKFWTGPERASCTKASSHHPSSYWLMWEEALVSWWYSSSQPTGPSLVGSNGFRMFLGIIEDRYSRDYHKMLELTCLFKFLFIDVLI